MSTIHITLHKDLLERIEDYAKESNTFPSVIVIRNIETIKIDEVIDILPYKDGATIHTINGEVYCMETPEQVQEMINNLTKQDDNTV